MKNLQWLIIGIGVCTGGIFPLAALANADSAMLLLDTIKLVIFLSISVATGFISIEALSNNYKINIHKAILIPWLAVLIVAFVINSFTTWALSLQITFVFSSIGGVTAYQRKVNKQLN